MVLKRDTPVMVIPIHNEQATIVAIVTAARQYGPVIVVDDASTDGSGCLAAEAGATVIALPRRTGKGTALQQGFAAALQRGARSVITLDGDGQHDAHDIPRLLRAAQRWPQSLICGDRLGVPEAVPRHRLQAIQVASFWLNWLGQCNVRDTQSGFRLYPAPLLRQLRLKCRGFLLESEVILKTCQAGYSIHTVPIRAIYPSGHASHYRPCKDGTMAALYLLYHGMRFWPAQLLPTLALPSAGQFGHAGTALAYDASRPPGYSGLTRSLPGHVLADAAAPAGLGPSDPGNSYIV